MTRKKKVWLIGAGVFAVAVVAALFITASIVARRFQPYIRQQAIAYLSGRFNANVALGDLHVRMPKTSPLRLLLTGGRGAIAGVEGTDLVLQSNDRSGTPPLFEIKRFSFEVDLATLFETPKHVPLVSLDGVAIRIPPKSDRPQFKQPDLSHPAVIIDRVAITDAKLVILPRKPGRNPLDFAIQHLRLDSAGIGVAMKYDAGLTNPRPPGQIHSTGKFGPWVAAEPGDTPLAGEYTFQNADLGVFHGIAGILNSTGQFQGALDSISAHGEASVPDFRLTSSGNPVPLWTRFEVLVDGTNGNTILKPVVARLGRTNFTTSGGIIEHGGEHRRAIRLAVAMPNGDLRDVLRLAMKGAPFMEGRLFLNTKIDIPPLSGTVRQKLDLDGAFRVVGGHFLRSNIQDQIDTLSRRGQGQPKNEKIDEVVSRMAGAFRLDNEVITFRALSFSVPGANVDLRGTYDLRADALDMRGSLGLDAAVSRTMTGWKRWALRPVDPFFEKHGAGTYLRIAVTGSSTDPHFGLDRRKKREEQEADRVKGRNSR